MIAKDLISELVSPLKPDDSGEQALSIMEELKLSHLPVVRETEFLGLLSDANIYDFKDATDPIVNHELSHFSPYVLAKQHAYEVVEVIGRLKLSLVPVLNENKEYLGSIMREEIIDYFAKMLASETPGGIIEINIHISDYSLSEIAQIVESSNVRILNLFTITQVEDMSLQLVIKLNTMDIASIIRSFERYGYDVRASYASNNKLEDFYKNRYEEFMKFLNI